MSKKALKPGWQIVRLGDVIEKTEYKDRNPESNGFTRFLKVEHLDPESLKIRRWGVIGEEELPPSFYKVFKTGQVLFPTRNPHLRRAAYANFDGICGEKTLTLQAKTDLLLSQFMPFIFQSEPLIEHATKHAIGSTNKHVRWKEVSTYEFGLPPIDEQRKLTEILLAIESALTADQECKTAAEQVFRSSLENLLHPEKRGWRTIPIGDICEVVSGGTPRRNKPEYWGGDIPWVKTGEVNYGLIEQTEEYITQEGLENSSAKLVPEGSVIMALFGQGPTLGRVAVLGIEACTNQACAVVLPSEFNNMKFIYYFLWREYGRIRAKARGASQPNINLSIVKSLLIPKISIDEQNFLVEHLDKLVETIKIIDERIFVTTCLKKQMLCHIF